MTYSNNDVYYGGFKDGRKHGYGVYYFFSGTVYEGYWERGRLHGMQWHFYQVQSKTEMNFLIRHRKSLILQW